MLTSWLLLEQYKTRLFLFCQEVLKGLDRVRKEMEEKEVDEGYSVKI